MNYRMMRMPRALLSFGLGGAMTRVSNFTRGLAVRRIDSWANRHSSNRWLVPDSNNWEKGNEGMRE